MKLRILGQDIKLRAYMYRMQGIEGTYVAAIHLSHITVKWHSTSSLLQGKQAGEIP